MNTYGLNLERCKFSNRIILILVFFTSYKKGLMGTKNVSLALPKQNVPIHAIKIPEL